ncbi:MAG: EAL domain-containing protein [Eubacteriaceae bacterium]|nr:EAL domain-containing protein [Eubacteriaceae bacterium]
MPRKVLIVDDNAIVRELLTGTLREDYDILEASNGQDALSLIHRNYKILSAVLLDIVMPGIDGYEVLRRVRENFLFAQLPIIIITGNEDEQARVKALSLGANDFIIKPFNPEIVRHCLRNNIALRETASIVNAIQKDKLTGVFNREAFFEKVTHAIKDKREGFYILSSFDIDNFKLVNDQYGAERGDEILKEIGITIRAEMEKLSGVAGRISADNFALLYPEKYRDFDLIAALRSRRLVLSEQQIIAFSIGRYVITDLSLPASALYDRAYIAKQSVKGRYDKHLAYFDEPMLEKLVLNQQITSEMETALRENQFEVWFQPQFNHENGKLIGAEALVRWKHPKKGIISPGDFISLFEQTGFVYELDKYVWARVCAYLRKWLDEGRDPLPVSVNVSRYDIFCDDFIDVIVGLVEEYNIPMDLLRLEITESAFSTSTDLIVKIVKQLINLGFTLEIDDFGSGYSSLNTLKNVPAQVVKLDMRFLEGDDESQRGGNILESIVRMTKWLGITVLAEGVEEKNQADFLKSIGCTYVQGYLYARPMVASEYEALCGGAGIKELSFSPQTVQGLDYSFFWNPDSFDTLIFNSFSGAACVFEYNNGSMEMIRVSEQYAHMVFGPEMSVENLLEIKWHEHLDENSALELKAALDHSARIKKEVTGEYLFYDLPHCPQKTYLKCSVRIIATVSERMLVYCVSENTTSHSMLVKMLGEQQQKSISAELILSGVLNNFPEGAAVFTVKGGDIELMFSNDAFHEILGHTKAQLRDKPLKFEEMIEARDEISLSEKLKESCGGKSVSFECKVIGGKERAYSNKITLVHTGEDNIPVYLCVLSEI